MKASIDRDACIGCELCVTICPEVFEMDDEQIATVITDPVPSEFQDSAEEAANSCPVGAINIEK